MWRKGLNVMGSYISNLETSFIKYLEKKGVIKQGEIKSGKDFNIFDYSEHLHDFMKNDDEVGYTGTGKGMDITTMVDILDSLDSSDTDIIGALESAKDEFKWEDEASDTIELLGEFLENDEIKEKLDVNSDDNVDREELLSFFSTNEGSRNDSDSRDITLRDLVDSAKTIKSDKYEAPEIQKWDKIVEKKGSKKADESSSADSASASSGGGSVGGSSGGGNVGGSGNNANGTTTEEQVNPIEVAQKNYEGKSVDELQQLKTDENKILDEQAQILQAAISGTAEATAAQKEQMDTSYQTFLDTCSAETELTSAAAEQREQLQATEIEANTVSVEKIDTELQKQGVDMQITSVEASITSVDTSISSLQAQLQAAQTASSVEDTSPGSDKGKYEAQIAALKSQIAQLTQQKQELETQKEELTKESEQLGQKITELQTTHQNLVTQYEQQSAALTETEKQLVATSEAAANAYNTYSNNKTAYETANMQLINNSVTARNTARANVEAIENQIIIAKNQESQKQVEQFNTDFEAGNYDPYIKKDKEEEEKTEA